jgi:hypothetical protein
MVFTAVLICISFASAAVAVVAPTAGKNLTGTFLANCSYVNGTDMTDPIAGNSSFYWNTTGSEVVFLTRAGFTVTGNAVWATLTTADSGIVDGYGSVKCALGNSTKGRFANASSGLVLIDDTSSTLVASPSRISYGRTVDYRCTDNVGTPTVSVAHPSGDTTSSTTLTGGTSYNLQFTDTDYKGDYVFTCTDYSGNAVTSTVSVSAPGASQQVQDMNEATASGGMSSNTRNLIIVGFLIAAALYLWYRK